MKNSRRDGIKLTSIFKDGAFFPKRNIIMYITSQNDLNEGSGPPNDNQYCGPILQGIVGGGYPH